MRLTLEDGLVALDQALRVAREAKALGAEFDLQGVATDAAQAVDDGVGVGDPAHRVRSVPCHFPGGRGHARDHQHGGGKSDQHLGFKTGMRIHSLPFSLCLFLRHQGNSAPGT
jgi:hypothetical protein